MFELIKWATSTGRLDELLAGALRQNPTSPELRRFAQETALSADALPSPALEALVLPGVGFEDVATWRARLARAEGRVARVEVLAARDTWHGLGTAFLLGPDLVLTNWHVAREFGGRPARVRFDYALDAAGIGIPGREVAFASGQPLAKSDVDDLDFALLRLAERAGADLRPDGTKRGWFEARPRRVQAGEPLLVLQHPAGERLKLGIGSVSSVSGAPRPRINYTTNTLSGSSGSPCLTLSLDVVALHQAAGNVGIPIGPVIDALGMDLPAHVESNVAIEPRVPGGERRAEDASMRVMRFAAIASPPDAPPPPSVPLPPPPDAPYDPRFYVHRREEERRALAKLAVPGSPVVLWSPSRFGASTMLRHLVERVAEEDATRDTEALLIEADLGALLPEPPSGPLTDGAVQARVDAFLGRFASHLLVEVRAGEDAFAAIANNRAGWALNLRILMEDHVLPRARGRLVLVLDRADALWGEPKVQGAFYRALRVWKDQAHKRLWSKLRLVLLISTTPAVVFDDPDHRDSPFYNLTADYIELLEFTTDQVVELARMHGLAWDSDVVSREITPLLGGHPYLLRVLMYRARLTGAPLPTLVGDDEALDRLYGAHLRELAALVERDPALRDALARVLDDPRSDIDEDRFQRLRRAGLAVRTKNGILVPNQLYERYLRRRWRR